MLTTSNDLANDVVLYVSHKLESVPGWNIDDGFELACDFAAEGLIFASCIALDIESINDESQSLAISRAAPLIDAAEILVGDHIVAIFQTARDRLGL